MAAVLLTSGCAHDGHVVSGAPVRGAKRGRGLTRCSGREGRAYSGGFKEPCYPPWRVLGLPLSLELGLGLGLPLAVRMKIQSTHFKHIIKRFSFLHAQLYFRQNFHSDG